MNNCVPKLEDGLWKPCVVPGGHFAPVNDLTWDSQGQYILSTSQDQTTRLHAKWLQPRSSFSVSWPLLRGISFLSGRLCYCRHGKIALTLRIRVVTQFFLQAGWHEVSRPQVHGYDMQCLASTGPFSFASGAEEKIVRLFRAPKNFLSNFSHLSGVDVLTEQVWIFLLTMRGVCKEGDALVWSGVGS